MLTSSFVHSAAVVVLIALQPAAVPAPAAVLALEKITALGKHDPIAKDTSEAMKAIGLGRSADLPSATELRFVRAVHPAGRAR